MRAWRPPRRGRANAGPGWAPDTAPAPIAAQIAAPAAAPSAAGSAARRMARALRARLHRRTGAALAAACALLLALPRVAAAQGQPAPEAPPPMLVADHVGIMPGAAGLVASGNVELIADGMRLRAGAVKAFTAEGRLELEGPIALSAGDGFVLLASAAEISPDLRAAILRSARLILERRLQIAAAEIERVGGRYTQLYKSVASSCRVCAGGQPLWEIRAERIIHDQLERQIYFDKAWLRMAGVPVFYVPRLRMPDPSVRRATGFLQPSLRSSSRLGTGIRIPYFLTLGQSADLTLTPYLSPRTLTLQGRYRQAFRNGRLRFDGALSSDRLRPGAPRAYLFGEGQFALRSGHLLTYNLQTTSDAAYLLDYGYSGADKLTSSLTLERTRPERRFEGTLLGFRTLRGSELPVAGQLPALQGRLRWEGRFHPARLGGIGSWDFSIDSHARASSADIAGRDMLRIGGRIGWERSFAFGPGLLARFGAGLRADAFAVGQDSTAAPFSAVLTPEAEAELRWPLIRQGSESGASDLLEPMLQLAYSRRIGREPPNEDSTLVEFDSANMLALSRFPGEDRREAGLRGAVGLQWSRLGPGGRQWSLSLGRVFRASDPMQFTPASGLDGTRSDWLIAGRLADGKHLDLSGRALLADDLTLTKTDAVLRWNGPRLSLSTTYSWIIPDSAEGRPSVTSQMSLDGSYRINDYWRAALQYRYDFDASKATQATLGLNYTNECIRLDLSLSRRFTSSTSATPITDVGLTVALLGFGNAKGGKARSCSGI